MCQLPVQSANFILLVNSIVAFMKPERRISLSGPPDNCEKDPGVQNEHIMQVTQ